MSRTFSKTKKITTMGLLFALAMVLSFVENTIVPFFGLPPGVKLGLSNIVVMYCMVYMGGSSATQLALLKGFFGFLMKNANTLPVSRSASYMAKNLKPALKKILEREAFVLIYPEQEMWFNYKTHRKQS